MTIAEKHEALEVDFMFVLGLLGTSIQKTLKSLYKYVHTHLPNPSRVHTRLLESARRNTMLIKLIIFLSI